MRRHSSYYVSCVQAAARSFDKLDAEFPQIRESTAWLAQQTDERPLESFLQVAKDLAAYLLRRALHSMLLEYCQSGLQIAGRIKRNPGWLLLLCYEAHWARGEWNLAHTSVQAAIEATRGSDPSTHAQAVLALGRLQLNRGEYGAALETLSKAERLLSEVSDVGGLATAKAEIAAYFLNRLEYRKALALYLEVDQYRRRADPDHLSEHTLLMLGVIYRRLKDHRKAEEYFNKVICIAEGEGNRGALATGLHHLAWVYFDQARLSEAKQLALRAKAIYEDICDPRGGSDVDEQLGRIATEECDLTSAQFFLERSLAVRERLGNEHGVASTLRRLSKFFLKRRNMWKSCKYLLRSLWLYHRLGMLSHQRILGIVRDL